MVVQYPAGLRVTGGAPESRLRSRTGPFDYHVEQRRSFPEFQIQVGSQFFPSLRMINPAQPDNQTPLRKAAARRNLDHENASPEPNPPFVHERP